MGVGHAAPKPDDQELAIEALEHWNLLVQVCDGINVVRCTSSTGVQITLLSIE